MSKQYTEAFLALLRAGLWEQDVRLSAYGQIDFSAIQELAEEQSVVGLIAAGMEHVVDTNVPKTDLLQFIGQTLQIEDQNKGMNQFIGIIVEKMRKEGIYTLLVKGQGIAQCYERPLWRSSGDVDLLLSKDNYDKAKAFLFPMADSIDPESGKHQGMTIGPWVVELHGYLHSGLSDRMDRVIDEAQNDVFCGGHVRSWMNGDTQVFLPSVDNDVVFIFTHFLKHFYKGGLGLRQICDWCRLLWTYRDSLNQKLLESRIRKMGLMSEWRAFGAFAVEYLGMPVESMPLYSTNKKWGRKAKRILGFVMMSGNFGQNRDMTYRQYSFLKRKCISLWQRVSDLIRHALIFPLDSFRFFPRILINGLLAASKGIG